jgi:hypothetical protein
VAEPREQSESVAADLRAGNDTVQSLAARKNYWQAPEESLRPGPGGPERGRQRRSRCTTGPRPGLARAPDRRASRTCPAAALSNGKSDLRPSGRCRGQSLLVTQGLRVTGRPLLLMTQIPMHSIVFKGIRIFFTANLFTCTMREDALMFCQFRFRIAKRLQQDDYSGLLPSFRPARFLCNASTNTDWNSSVLGLI